MRTIHREMEKVVLEAAGGFPAVVLTGPRRAGKTFLLRHLFPRASYHLFEDPDIVSRFRADPRGFFESVRPPAILDEIQNVPEIFPYVRGRIDATPRRTGQWILTGSQEAGLMKGVTESMAGRAAVLSLWPMSARETDKVSLLRGGYPEVLARPDRRRSGSHRTCKPTWSAMSGPSARSTISRRSAASWRWSQAATGRFSTSRSFPRRSE